MKFSIRGVLMVIAMIAVVLGWTLDHLRLQDEVNRLNAENTELMDRIIPSSGFAGFPSGLGTKTIFLHSNPEDRKELLQLLDRSLTHGKTANIPMERLESANDEQ
jgi:hypothetical protein